MSAFISNLLESLSMEIVAPVSACNRTPNSRGVSRRVCGLPLLSCAAGERQSRTGDPSEVRQEGLPLVKIIHRNGSTGVGGDIRIAVEAGLREMESDGGRCQCIFGEDGRRDSEAVQRLFEENPS